MEDAHLEWLEDRLGVTLLAEWY